MLRTKQITLLNPATWDDKNDAYYMAEYKRIIEAKTVLALCFAECYETYHHWRVFSHGSDGVCIEFDKSQLVSRFARNKDVCHGDVNYKTIKYLSNKNSIKAIDLPFFKRKPFQDEHEYRVIYTSKEEIRETLNFDIKITWIKKITLSPWMPKDLIDPIKSTLRAIPGCERLRIFGSTLIENDEWRAATSRARL